MKNKVEIIKKILDLLECIESDSDLLKGLGYQAGIESNALIQLIKAIDPDIHKELIDVLTVKDQIPSFKIDLIKKYL